MGEVVRHAELRRRRFGIVALRIVVAHVGSRGGIGARQGMAPPRHELANLPNSWLLAFYDRTFLALAASPPSYVRGGLDAERGRAIVGHASGAGTLRIMLRGGEQCQIWWRSRK